MKKFLLCVAALMGYASASMAANFSFTIGETGISVVAPQVSCDFTDSKVRAFIVTGASGSTVTVKQVKKVQAGTTFIVAAPAGSYSVPNVSGGYFDNVAGNKLAMAAKDQQIAAHGERGLLESTAQIKASSCGLDNCFNMIDFSTVDAYDVALSNLIDGNRESTFSTVFDDARKEAVTDGGTSTYGHIQVDLLKAYNGVTFKFIGRTGNWPDNPTDMEVYGTNDAAAFNVVDAAKNTSAWTKVATLTDIVKLDAKNIMTEYYVSPKLTGNYRYLRFVVTNSQLFKNGTRTDSHKYKGIMGYEYGEFQVCSGEQTNTYVLNASTGQFEKLSTDFTATAEMPYIQVYGTTASSLNLSAITAIDQITTNGTQTGDDAYYDLTGRRVSTPAAGVYIHQGKKVVIK